MKRQTLVLAPSMSTAMVDHGISCRVLDTRFPF